MPAGPHGEMAIAERPAETLDVRVVGQRHRPDQVARDAMRPFPTQEGAPRGVLPGTEPAPVGFGRRRLSTSRAGSAGLNLSLRRASTHREGASARRPEITIRGQFPPRTAIGWWLSPPTLRVRKCCKSIKYNQLPS